MTRAWAKYQEQGRVRQRVKGDGCTRRVCYEKIRDFDPPLKMEVLRSVGGGVAWWGRVRTRRGGPPRFFPRDPYHGGV
jgi:hypothetical protein